MKTPTWHLERAKAVLEEWYAKAEYNLKLIDRYKITHPFLGGKKEELDGNCRRQALMCKTYGLIFHDQYKTMFDGCWRKVYSEIPLRIARVWWITWENVV